jgi:hypothetical protein
MRPPTIRRSPRPGAQAPDDQTWRRLRVQKTEIPRGQITVMLAVLMAGLIAIVGLISRPGAPAGAITLEYGWFVALAAALGAIATGLARQPRARRKPPGV